MWTRVWLQAIRRLGRRPGIFLTSVLVLGTGLGLAVFLFSLVQKTILQPLPFPQPDRLVVIGHAQDNGLGIGSLGTDLLLDLHGKRDGVGTVGAYSMSSMVLGGGGHAPAAYEQGASLTASALHMLDVRPVLGRGFLPADEAPGATPVVLLGASLWRQRYHADPHILGRSLRVDGVGPGWSACCPNDSVSPVSRACGCRWMCTPSQPMQVVALARLGPGATVAQVRARTARLAAAAETVVQRRQPCASVDGHAAGTGRGAQGHPALGGHDVPGQPAGAAAGVRERIQSATGAGAQPPPRTGPAKRPRRDPGTADARRAGGRVLDRAGSPAGSLADLPRCRPLAGTGLCGQQPGFGECVLVRSAHEFRDCRIPVGHLDAERHGWPCWFRSGA